MMDGRQADTFAFMTAVTCFTTPVAAAMLGYIAHYNFGLSRLEIRKPAVVGAVIIAIHQCQLIFSVEGCASHDPPKLQEAIAMFAKLIRAIVVVTTTCLIIWTGNARAEILITTAAISRGELTIVGRVRRPREPSVHIKISPNKTVQVEKSSTGGFRWIGPEFPPHLHSRN
jgi:hypothetical protein